MRQKLKRFRIAFAFSGRDEHVEGAMMAPLGCQSEDACERWFVANYVKPKGSRYELLAAYEVQ